MASFGKNLLAAVAVVSLGSAFASVADAAPITFSFTDQAGTTSNLVDLNVSAGLGQQTTIVQGLHNGSPSGQAFTDVGTLFVNSGDTLAGPTSVAQTGPLKITYSLTGTQLANGNLSFNAGGTINLFENGVNIAIFSLVSPSGSTGSNFSNFNSLVAGTIQLSLVQTGGTIADVFGTAEPGTILELADIVPTFNDPSTFTVGPCDPSNPLFDGSNACETLTTRGEAGQVFVGVIPEPGSLALIGSSLLGIAFLRRRKSTV